MPEQVEVDDDAPLDFGAMKKKSKKKPPSSVLPDAGQNENSQPQNDAADEVDFTQLKKKKQGVDLRILDDLPSSERPDEAVTLDLTYDELLERVFAIMRERNPNAGEKKQFVLRPPEVVKAGAKKSSYVNFLDNCKQMNREPKHVLSFILAELGTSGSIDGNNTLILKGKFQVKQMENILRRYIKEYVMCHTCKSKDTKLHKSDRLMFLQCDACQSRCTVTNIRSGFQAVTTKRAAQRAKEN
jgi:translation initiation factor 2 subunit 2